MIQKITDLPSLWHFRDSLEKQTLAFVPTMGALHEGHLSLAREGLKQADQVIVSIFVNPTQFAPGEDFDAYPRKVEEDIEKLDSIGVQSVWLPSVEDIYPNGVEIDLRVKDITDPLEGKHRPHFFDGVVTVVSRLFCAVQPDVALFGEKDFQQLQVIKMLVHDLNLPINVIGVPTIRDENGLALSSRNAYLSEDEYKIAVKLNTILKELAEGTVEEDQAQEKLLQAGFDKVDYCTRRYSKTLQSDDNKNDRVLAAVWLGKTRLIDNMPIPA